MLGALAVGGIAVSAILGEELELVRAAVGGAGVWGAVVFMVFHVVVCLLPVPRNALAAVAGSLFGLPVGAALSITGSAAAALVTFALARRFGREAVTQVRSPRIDRVQRVLHDHGPLALVTARLTPVAPFVITNYAAGLRSVRTRDYVASLVALVPGSIAWATVGTGATAGMRVLYIAATAALVVIVGVALARHITAREA